MADLVRWLELKWVQVGDTRALHAVDILAGQLKLNWVQIWRMLGLYVQRVPRQDS